MNPKSMEKSVNKQEETKEGDQTRNDNNLTYQDDKEKKFLEMWGLKPLIPKDKLADEYLKMVNRLYGTQSDGNKRTK